MNASFLNLLWHAPSNARLRQTAISARAIIKQELGGNTILDKALKDLCADPPTSQLPVLETPPQSEANQIRLWCERALESEHSQEAELIASLIAASDLDQISEECINVLAGYHERTRSTERAVGDFRELLKRKPDSQEAAYQLAFALHIEGHSDEGIEALWPQVIATPNVKNLRLFGLMLKTINAYDDAIHFLKSALELCHDDEHTRHLLLNIYITSDMQQNAIDLIASSSPGSRTIQDHLLEALLYRSIGDLELSIELTAKAISDYPEELDPLWLQCFNFSISNAQRSEDLLRLSARFWHANCGKTSSDINFNQRSSNESKRIKIGFLSADLGDHVVSHFLAPLLRDQDQNRYEITVLSTIRRYDAKSALLSQSAHKAISLQGLSLEQATSTIASLGLDIIIETGGFTLNSGIQYLANRCAPIQCHYIGYHATTGLETIDYFIGDPILTPPEFAAQFTEQIATLPSPWISYDSQTPFPDARAKIEVEQPVFGSFSQAAKIGSETLAFWTAAMAACEDAILIIKGKGSGSPVVQQRLMACFETAKIDPSRIIFANAVPSQQEHLDYYNKIDIALDTTPWSGATTAFEALGMGVPLIGIRGDTTSGRMSSSVLSAAGMQDHIADSVEEFAEIAQRLAAQFQAIRAGKAAMQQRIRSSILFDDTRIRQDFFALIDQLVATHKQSSRAS